MAYQMQALLAKCDVEDLRFLAKQIDSYVNLTDDKRLKDAIAQFSTSSTAESKLAVLHLLEAEIRYVGSSEVAYAKRKLLNEEQPYGVEINEIIDDTSAKLKIKQKFVVVK